MGTRRHEGQRWRTGRVLKLKRGRERLNTIKGVLKWERKR